MASEVSLLCQLALQRHRNAALWLNLWTILIWVFGAAVVAFLVLAIVLFLGEEWLPAGLTTLASIAEGAAIKWVVDRRAEALDEERQAYEKVQEVCLDTGTAEDLRDGLRLMGRVL
jgi:hypothetical protein